jgi:hypothetical protein
MVERLRDVLRLVVDRRVESELLDDVAALVRPTGDTDGAAALDLGDLTDDRADRSGGARHDHRVARLGLSDVQQSEVGGQPGHAERADVDRQRREVRVNLDDGVPAEDGVLLDTGDPRDVVTGLEAGMA